MTDFLRWCRNEWERAIAIVALVGGLGAFIAGWLGQQQSVLVTQQIPFVVSGGLFGLLLIIVGTTIWLSADLHDEWIKLDRFEETVARAAAALEMANERSGGAHRATGLQDPMVLSGANAGSTNARERRVHMSAAEAGE